MIRIKFTGDIMCQMSQNEACRNGGRYNYTPVFEPVRNVLGDCDFLVGNLETPLAGEKHAYSHALYSFNTPDAFATALKDVGFDLLSTANNHCMDRGVEGLTRTLQVLKEAGLDAVGTDASPVHAPCVHSVGGIPVGFVAATYGTNAFFHGRYLPDAMRFAVHLLQPEELTEGAIDLLADAAIAAEVERLYGRPCAVFEQRIAPLHARLKAEVEACRAAGARFVFFLLHCGGQYNAMPDAYTQWMVRRIQSWGVDAIIGHHPHVIHPLVQGAGCPAAYSLGNFCYTPEKEPRGARLRGAYSAVLCLHLDEEKGLVGITHELTKSVVREDGVAQVIPAAQLLRQTSGARRAELEEDIRFCQGVLATPEGRF